MEKFSFERKEIDEGLAVFQCRMMFRLLEILTKMGGKLDVG